jgi:hypothetical protein
MPVKDDFLAWANPQEKLEAVDYSDTHTQNANEEFIAEARAMGATVTFPGDGELQLDFDTEEQWLALDYKLNKFHRVFQGTNAYVYSVTPSVSGLPHRHVVLFICRSGVAVNLTETERVALQMFFGSDTNRELHNLCRVMQGCEHPTLFLEGLKWHQVAGIGL